MKEILQKFGYRKIKNGEFKRYFGASYATFIGMDQCHQAAVCIPLLKNASGGYDVLFEVRAATIAHQPGDVCLPGGMVEEGETPREAALRELQEELLLNKDQICYLGDMDKLYTGSRLIMYSFAAEVTEYQNTFSPAEVDEVFHVPLEFFFTYGTKMLYHPGKGGTRRGFPL